MKNETKAGLLMAYLGMIIFMAGTFIPLTPKQIERQKIVLDDVSLWNYNFSTALCLLIVNIALLDLGYNWKWTKGIGFFFVLSSLAWLCREVMDTATHYCWVNTAVMCITGILLFIQHNYKSK